MTYRQAAPVGPLAPRPARSRWGFLRRAWRRLLVTRGGPWRARWWRCPHCGRRNPRDDVGYDEMMVRGEGFCLACVPPHFYGWLVD